MATFRQGDTTTIGMAMSRSIGDNHLKIGIYTPNGKPLFETSWPDGGMIHKVDDLNYILEIPHEMTMLCVGSTTLRATEYTSDKSLVNSGENSIPINWASEPVNRNL